MADGLLLSQLFQITAPCDDEDIVYRTSINGGLAGNPWQIKPWVDAPIFIRYAQIIKVSGGAHTFLMIGSNVTGDAMVFLPCDRMEATTYYPTGTYKYFPPMSQTASTDYMDLHGSATGGGQLQVFVNFGFTQGALAPSPSRKPALDRLRTLAAFVKARLTRSALSRASPAHFELVRIFGQHDSAGFPGQFS
jgi:hypothetical protein